MLPDTNLVAFLRLNFRIFIDLGISIHGKTADKAVARTNRRKIERLVVQSVRESMPSPLKTLSSISAGGTGLVSTSKSCPRPLAESSN